LGKPPAGDRGDPDGGIRQGILRAERDHPERPSDSSSTSFRSRVSSSSAPPITLDLDLDVFVQRAGLDAGTNVSRTLMACALESE